jgi:hypothetical protein
MQLGCVMRDIGGPSKATANSYDLPPDMDSLRDTLSGLGRAVQHLGEISKSLERIARALEKTTARLP